MAESGTIIFSPAWLSTIKHQETFNGIVSEASTITKILGSYKMPPDFPHLHLWWGIFSFFRVPIVMVASGRLTVSGERLRFESQPWGKNQILGGNIYKNLQTDLSFELSAGEILRVEQYQNPEPIISYYNLSWTRILTTKTGILSDMLMAVGGTGPRMGPIRERNAELFSILNRMCEPGLATNERM